MADCAGYEGAVESSRVTRVAHPRATGVPTRSCSRGRGQCRRSRGSRRALGGRRRASGRRTRRRGHGRSCRCDGLRRRRRRTEDRRQRCRCCAGRCAWRRSAGRRLCRACQDVQQSQSGQIQRRRRSRGSRCRSRRRRCGSCRRDRRYVQLGPGNWVCQRRDCRRVPGETSEHQRGEHTCHGAHSDVACVVRKPLRPWVRLAVTLHDPVSHCRERRCSKTYSGDNQQFLQPVTRPSQRTTSFERPLSMSSCTAVTYIARLFPLAPSMTDGATNRTFLNRAPGTDEGPLRPGRKWTNGRASRLGTAC